MLLFSATNVPKTPIATHLLSSLISTYRCKPKSYYIILNWQGANSSNLSKLLNLLLFKHIHIHKINPLDTVCYPLRGILLLAIAKLRIVPRRLLVRHAPFKTCSAQVRPSKNRSTQIRPFKIRLAQVRLHKVSVAQIRPTKIGLLQLRLDEERPSCINLNEMSAIEISFAHIQVSQNTFIKDVPIDVHPLRHSK